MKWDELLGLVGVVLVIKYGSIFQVLRLWLKSKIPILGYLVTCSLCLGFELGAAYGLWSNWSRLLFYAGAVATVAWVTDHIIMALTKYIKHEADPTRNLRRGKRLYKG